MKLLFLLLTSITTLLFSLSASAINLRCEGCNEDQIYNLVKSYGQGEHTVFSLSTGFIKTYSVYYNPSDGQPGENPLDPNPTLGDYAVVEVSTSVAQLQEFQSLLNLYQISGGTLKFEITVPINDIPVREPLDFSGMTSFEFALNPGNHHRVIEGAAAYANSWHAARHSNTYFQTFGSITGISGSSIIVNVQFADGGKVKIEIEVSNTTGEQRGPIQDRNGNPIPIRSSDPNDFAGTYIVESPVDLTNLGQHFADIGWGNPFSGNPTQGGGSWGDGGGGRVRDYDCHFEGPDNRKWVCEYTER